MKKIVAIIVFMGIAVSAFAQDLQTIAAEVAAAITSAPDVEAAPPKPRYWKAKMFSTVNFTQLALSNWTAGGYNTVSLSSNIDAVANYARGKVTGNNHLQLDYGFFYSKDKPIIQKNKDRIQFESLWGYASPVRDIVYTAQFTFKTQFDNNYTYGTPSVTDPTVQDWLDARTLKSGFLSPAYIDLGIGAKWVATKWLTVNFAPLTGGYVIVDDPLLRVTYGMKLKEGVTTATSGRDYRNSKFQLGAKLTVDGAVNINDNIRFTTQVVLFSDYLDKPLNMRVNWDNKLFWQVAKYFALTFSTYMIYDDTVIIPELGHQGVQFKEYFEFGFAHTIASKK